MFEGVKNYFSAKVNLAKYEIIKAVVDIFSAIFSKFIIFSLCFLTLVFSSIWLAFYISESQDQAKGFGWISLGYFIFTMILILFRRLLFGSFLKNFLTQIIFKKSTENKDD